MLLKTMKYAHVTSNGKGVKNRDVQFEMVEDKEGWRIAPRRILFKAKKISSNTRTSVK